MKAFDFNMNDLQLSSFCYYATHRRPTEILTLNSLKNGEILGHYFVVEKMKIRGMMTLGLPLASMRINMKMELIVKIVQKKETRQVSVPLFHKRIAESS